MKKIVLSVVLSLFSIHGYGDSQINLVGEDAVSLRDALIQAGASAPFVFEGRFIKVSNIHVARTPGYMPYAEVSFDDDQNSGENIIANNRSALILFDQLVKIGVEAELGDETDHRHIFIQSINCSPLGAADAYQCEVILPNDLSELSDSAVENAQKNTYSRGAIEISDQCHSGQYLCNDRCISRWLACSTPVRDLGSASIFQCAKDDQRPQCCMRINNCDY